MELRQLPGAPQHFTQKIPRQTKSAFDNGFAQHRRNLRNEPMPLCNDKQTCRSYDLDAEMRSCSTTSHFIHQHGIRLVLNRKSKSLRLSGIEPAVRENLDRKTRHKRKPCSMSAAPAP